MSLFSKLFKCLCACQTDASIQDSYRLYDNTTSQVFKIEPDQQWARVIDVYDGDTITCVLRLHKIHIYKFQIRLVGVDTCEMRSKNPAVKAKAIEARQFVIQTISGCSSDELQSLTTRNDIKAYFNAHPRFVWVHVLGFDKYGRVLANVFLNRPARHLRSSQKITQKPTSLSEALVEHRLAFVYDGKTKLTEDAQYEQMCQGCNRIEQ